ncbi:Maf family protein [Thioalkalivibrio sp. HK1]|uniref:Maf family protein n=1 Tax=Thioalkalivibrio sp. HK1 TaxID=1469245 RepID=UPI00046FF91C|nr:Maf family nucleotide pyrophosphatase [Thioalkalivibrio sp. HK1]
MPPLILASSSPSRRSLLARLGLAFTVMPPDIDESPLAHETPKALAMRLSMEKAQAVARGLEKGLVIGSDQVATVDERLLGKPGGHAENLDQLRSASGKWMEFHTGIALIDAQSNQMQVDAVPFGVKLRTLSEDDIASYVAHERAFDCAGGFKAERLGCTIFEETRGPDPTALLGLPMIRLCAMLRNAGFDPLSVLSKSGQEK